MGNTTAIAVDDACTVQPHAGATCMKVDYTAEGNWAGVVWQSPPDDWGDRPGGHDLTGAKQLVFWARGHRGGEKVECKLGVIARDKKFHDSATATTGPLTLTAEWTRYAIPLAGKDLSHIKTGFAWIVAGQGRPITFYLDDIRYE